jgi:hypothetical protein
VQREKEMASSGNGRGGLLSAGGVLSIVAGISQIISGVALVVNTEVLSSYYRTLPELSFLPFLPTSLRDGILGIYLSYGITIQWVIIGVCIGVLGILAVVGGLSAIRRKRFGLSLAGAICALPSCILGIPAVIFVALGKREFGAEKKEDGV